MVRDELLIGVIAGGLVVLLLLIIILFILCCKRDKHKKKEEAAKEDGNDMEVTVTVKTETNKKGTDSGNASHEEDFDSAEKRSLLTAEVAEEENPVEGTK